MNLKNFDKYIDNTILKRGYTYFIDGSITETYKNGDNKYFFKVQGSEEYEVIIEIDDQGEIISSECDCPYDFGSICKHKVAAFYELQDIVDSLDDKLLDNKQINKQLELKDILNNLSKQELIDIIIEMTNKDITLKNTLIVRYSEGDSTEDLENCRSLVESIAEKYTGSGGFVSYTRTYDFTNEMEAILDKARKTDDIFLAVDIELLILNEAIEAFQYSDDSNGEIGYLVSEAMTLIRETIEDIPNIEIDLKEKVFDRLLSECNNEVFDDWNDYRIDLLWLCAEFADVETLRTKLILKINNLVSKSSNELYDKYCNENMLKIQYDLIKSYGTENELTEFINENLKYTYFREILIDNLIKQNDFEKVIKLTLEGEKQDSNYAGLVSNWKEIRYDAYKNLYLIDEQKKLAKELLLDGNFKYYKELKALVSEDKLLFYNNLKNELKGLSGWRSRDIFLELIVKENDLDEIMEYVRKNPSKIEKYAMMLLKEYKDEVIQIYIIYIKEVANSSSNRRDYQSVSEVIKRYGKLAGKSYQLNLINELKISYKRKPAFVDELSKI